MPSNSSAPITYIPIEALEKAGVEAPKIREEFEAIAPKLEKAGYIPPTASQWIWPFVESFKSRNTQQFATNNSGYDGIESTEIIVDDANTVMMFDTLKAWAESLFSIARAAGFTPHGSPEDQPTTRPSLITRIPARAMKLDWFLSRGLRLGQTAIHPGLEGSGRPLSDDDRIETTIEALA